MLPEVGNFSLILSLFFAGSLAIVPIIGYWRHNPILLSTARPLTLLMSCFVLVSFIVLAIAFLTNDFSVLYVSLNSNSNLPIWYKFSAIWGSHEGSLLLWVLILCRWSTAVALKSHTLPKEVGPIVLSVLGMVATGFLLFMLFTSSPFVRDLPNVPANGEDLNPLLQDVGLVIHPPMLYMGYVGFSVAFAFAIAALITGNLNSSWARWARPWTAVSWAFLTLGITLGSWWAYYELGWGGWWFWDPVENASLMPWLAATALLHSAIVVEKRGQLKSWTVLLAILAFSLSLVGTFIVRSGLLTSVHSFASDPARGVFILGILIVAVGIPLLLYAWRGPQLMTAADFDLKSREGALIANNMLLVVATAIVLLGTFYPLGLEMVSGARITVGPPYFDATFNPVMGILVLIMVIGPVMAWRRGITPRAKTTLLTASVTALITGIIGIAMRQDIAIGALAAVMLIVWLATGIAADVWTQLKPLQRGGFAARWQRLPSDVLGMWIAHFGIVVFLLGSTGDGLFRSEQVVRAKPGDVVTIAGRDVTLVRVFERGGPNFQALTAELEYKDASSGKIIARLMPEKRVYTAERQTTTEAAIRPRPSGDDYAVLGDGDERIGYSLRLYYKPLISWIWGGAGLMAAGGLVAMVGRRRQSTITAPLPKNVAQDTA